MPDNVTVDNGALTDIDVASDKVTYSGDADRDVQLIRSVHVTGAEGSKTVEAVTGTIGSATPTAAVVLGGHDGTNLQAIKVDTSGEAQVDVLTLPSIPAGTNNIGDVDIASIAAGDNNIGNVDVVTLPSIPAGTNNIGDVDVLTLPSIPAGTNNIGDVDIASIAAGDNNIGNVDIVTMPNVTLAAGTNTNEVVGDVAHDAAAAGNPVLIGASHETAADSAPANRVSADGDATRLSAMDGALYVIPGGPQQWKARLTGTMSDTTVKAAPGAGLSLYIQTVVYSIGAATASSIMLEESTTTPVFGPHYLENVSGRGVAVTFNPPIKITANTLLSATNTGSTTATLDVYGFTALG